MKLINPSGQNKSIRLDAFWDAMNGHFESSRGRNGQFEASNL